MDIGITKKVAPSLPFKGNPQKEEKDSSSMPFIAGSTAIGAVVGALTPERLVIKNSDEVTQEHLSELLKTADSHVQKLGKVGVETLKTAASSALNAIKAFTDKPDAKEDASMFSETSIEALQEAHFKTLKKLVPTEPVWHSTARGAAIGGSIALGIVVAAKVLDEISPPKDNYAEYQKNANASQTIKSFES